MKLFAVLAGALVLATGCAESQDVHWSVCFEGGDADAVDIRVIQDGRVVYEERVDRPNSPNCAHPPDGAFSGQILLEVRINGTTHTEPLDLDGSHGAAVDIYVWDDRVWVRAYEIMV